MYSSCYLVTFRQGSKIPKPCVHIFLVQQGGSTHYCYTSNLQLHSIDCSHILYSWMMLTSAVMTPIMQTTAMYKYWNGMHAHKQHKPAVEASERSRHTRTCPMRQTRQETRLPRLRATQSRKYFVQYHMW